VSWLSCSARIPCICGSILVLFCRGAEKIEAWRCKDQKHTGPLTLVQTMWLTRWRLQEESVQIDWIPGRTAHLGWHAGATTQLLCMCYHSSLSFLPYSCFKGPAAFMPFGSCEFLETFDFQQTCNTFITTFVV